MATMQNEYSLLCRLYDTDMTELSHHEDVTLFSFSPLAAGLLTGKYQDGAVPEGSRMAINGNLGGRKSARVFDAVQAYADIAARHGLDLAHMSMAWQRARPVKVSAIFGATTVAQLEHLLRGADLELSGEILEQIDEAHRANPMPY
jgi:aryl-alcohol dehydrogenase-like predicted oxidoreductase